MQNTASVAANVSVPDTGALVQKTVYPILFTISLSHLLNDMMQSVIPAVYPLIKQNFGLNFTQIGLITLTFQLTASLLQPVIGAYTDRSPRPYSLATGMTFTLAGLVFLAYSFSFTSILLSVACIGIGSSVFHPESSRVAHMASGGKRGLAQSLFQLGGNVGSSLGPLLAALIVMPYGQTRIVWFAIAAVVAIILLTRVGHWYKAHLDLKRKTASGKAHQRQFSKPVIIRSLIILLILMFSKFFYMSCMGSYFTFFLIDKFKLPVQQSQLYLFLFLAAVAAGTFIGGPLGDRFGRKYIIWISILGAAPFTLMLPYVNLFWTAVLSMLIGVIIASAFSAILVFATDLIPGKVGLVAGLFFGLAFGLGGLGSAVLGKLADITSIQHVFRICAYLPLLGVITGFLPTMKKNE